MDVMSAVRAGHGQSLAELVNDLRAEAVEVRSSGLNPRVQKDRLKTILKQLDEAQRLFVSMGASGRYGADLAASAATEVSAHLAAASMEAKREVLAVRKTIEGDSRLETGISNQVQAQADRVVYLCLVGLLALLLVGFPLFLLFNLMADPVTTLGGLGIVGVCYWLKASVGR
jgi:hypothetical protein